MIAVRVSRRVRRIGYGIAFGAGIALAPIAAGAASADTGTAADAPPATASVQRVQPVVVPRVAAKPAAAKAVAKPLSGKQAAAKPAAVRGVSADRRPVVVIGASVSSGKEVSSAQAYPHRVAAISGRPVQVSSRVGAGYADGSIARLTRAANLPAQNPSLVVLQAGTNDVGAPPALVAGQVRQVVSTVRQQAPGAKIAVVTVFPSIHSGDAARTTDAAIIGAARSVDPSVVVISPLSEGWNYTSSEDGHPGSAAHLRIAERVAGLV
ncbi:SGNH/GDSL hydrolase family protein [Tsukamurella ocularis]|uniref:SGNH/GDSL hydrolase family protein n=1 Tax=Tsukamurella ocularis TaxID=1970234 RepID=UPI002168BF7F|nr:SGNH/GDSL hydrolase family protein [Tsukamurella ocularis]MCS3781354.1 lysophospholipase L1-like esterase [Tsukamurella ocularis]MCS3787725.1 lysophospholipase L1-like esterase [Tsukamurella ocularis]MCS3851020.1 lysophospholipase L1-like esterase [Tsukamurella ocularis]